MSHFSPFVFLLWSVLSVCLGGFYFYHLWKYDRFRCINPFESARSGAFQRVMTYSYLLAVPTLLAWTIGFAVIKYQEGFIQQINGQLYPKPLEMWTPQHQALYTPLTALWALTWVLESLTHLEELCFWLYLVHAGPTPVPWFRSLYFRIWVIGSVSSAIIILTVMGATTSDPLMNEVYFQLAGSLIGLFITIAFLPVLFSFSGFIQAVRNEGGDMKAVVRLAKFHDLNVIRTVFRFLFVFPVLILAIDGLRPHEHPVNSTMSTTDVLLVIAGIACMVQSVCTLMIFFPRDFEMETQRWLQSIPERRSRSYRLKSSISTDQEISFRHLHRTSDGPTYLLTNSPVKASNELPLVADGSLRNNNSPIPHYVPELSYQQQNPPHYPFAHYSSAEAHSRVSSFDQNVPTPPRSETPSALTEANMRMFARDAVQVNPLALYFRSPLDFDDSPARRQHWGVQPV